MDAVIVAAEPSTVDAGASSETAGDLRRRLVSDRPALIELSHLIVEQTRINIAVLKEQRSNSPEAKEVIEGLEETLSRAEELKDGLEKDEPPDETIDRVQRLIDALFESVERCIKTDLVVKTAVAGVAAIVMSSLGVPAAASAVLIYCVFGKKEDLKKAKDKLKGLMDD